MPDIIKPKRATRSVANKSEKVLEKDELLLISPDTGSGTGNYAMKVGDGITPTKDLPYAIDYKNADEMIVEKFSEESDENPVLSPGDKIKTICGKLLKKFTYLETLLGKKVSISDIYNGLDSTSTSLVASANTVRQVNEKTDKNASDITKLNSNIENLNKAETIWIFKPNEGLFCEYKPGMYTNVSITSDNIVITPKNNTQGIQLAFSQDLSLYLGKGYYVKITFKISRINVDFVGFQAVSYNPYNATNSKSLRKLYPGTKDNELLSLIIPLDDCAYPQYPCLMISYYMPGTSVTMTVTELCVVKNHA